MTPEITRYTGPILVTLVYFVLWYSLLFGNQFRTKKKLIKRYRAEGKKFDRYFGQDPEMLAADRSVINTQEQMIPFLVSMWLYAVVVSPQYATVLGTVYIVLRSIYPFLLGAKIVRVQSSKVAFVTIPCYIIVFTMMIGTVIGIMSSL